MNEMRCESCNKLLARLDILEGTVQIKCPWCNAMNEYCVTCEELAQIEVLTAEA